MINEWRHVYTACVYACFSQPLFHILLGLKKTKTKKWKHFIHFFVNKITLVKLHLFLFIYTIIQKLGIDIIFSCFWKYDHDVFDQIYSKNSDIVKYYYNVK